MKRIKISLLIAGLSLAGVGCEKIPLENLIEQPPISRQKIDEKDFYKHDKNYRYRITPHYDDLTTFILERDY